MPSGSFSIAHAGRLLTQGRSTTRAGEHTGRRDLVPASRAIEPIATILALGVGKALFLFALGTHAIHLAIGDIVFKDQATFRTDFGVATMIRSLTTRRRTDKNRMTGITPVFATSHFFTNRALFHQNSSKNSISNRMGEYISHQKAFTITKIIIFRLNFQSIVYKTRSCLTRNK